MIWNPLLWNPLMIWLQQRIEPRTKLTSRSLASGILSDLTRSRSDLIAENALLRQQLIVLHRQVKRPLLIRRDRFHLVLLACCTRFWKQAVHIVQPDTLLRWHRELFRFYWRRKSQGKHNKPKIPPETTALIRKMARDNLLWGAERIRGELLKLGINACKRTIQKYMSKVRGSHSATQTWAAFIRNHARDI